MVTRERSSSQLCAGFKIKRKPTPLFFTYSGEGRNMVFKKLTKPLRGWKPAHLSVREAYEYKIGCSFGQRPKDYIADFFSVFGVVLKTFKKSSSQRVPSGCSQSRYIGDIYLHQKSPNKAFYSLDGISAILVKRVNG